MTVRIQRDVTVALPVEAVWDFIADPGERAAAISVVESYDVHGDGATWHVRLPIPLVRKTIAVETRDVEREPPEYVRFVGRSSVFQVTGEHELEAVEAGTRLTSRFAVDGRVPGVEHFFSKNLDGELANLERRLRSRVDA